jgi:hypothetical protein
MPDLPISLLPPAAALGDDDLFAVVQAGVTDKASVAQVRDACTKQRVDVLTTDAIITYWGFHFVESDTVLGLGWTDIPLSAATQDTPGVGSLVITLNLRIVQPSTYASAGTFEVDFQVGGYLQPGVYQTLVFSSVQGQAPGFTFNASITFIVEDSGPLASPISMRGQQLAGTMTDVTVAALHSTVTLLATQLIRPRVTRVVQAIDELITEGGDELITEGGDELITEG